MSTRLSPAFKRKKEKILCALALDAADYTDLSPKGSVDTPIIDLIKEINHIEGLVTTSSCSGRVAVFAERTAASITRDEGKTLNGVSDIVIDDDDTMQDVTGKANTSISIGPGGKGNGGWLFVSHEPVPQLQHLSPDIDIENKDKNGSYTSLCQLTRSPACLDQSASHRTQPQTEGLIRLSYSPLILHVLAAELKDHARPLLAAAINAGFRESGVQSLASLVAVDHSTDVGSMVAIRTAGLAFETVIGRVVSYVRQDGTRQIINEAMTSEEYLEMCFGVINERFVWNESRRQRLMAEIRRAFARVEQHEEKDERRRRKRQEGLLKQAADVDSSTTRPSAQQSINDPFEENLYLDAS